MTKISISRETLLLPLQEISSVVEKRQTLPILSNVLFTLRQGILKLSATDLEIELQTLINVPSDEDTQFTVPARKIFDIVRGLTESADINLTLKGDHLTVISGRSRFRLGVLPAADFPSIETKTATESIRINPLALKRLLEHTAFSMAQQDVRYYLNGLLMEITSTRICTVGTDGHRLAFSELAVNTDVIEPLQVILPRKAVLELNRLITPSDEDMSIELSSNHARFLLQGKIFTSKLIDGRFPDYQRVIPEDNPVSVFIDRIVLRSALQRAAILSNEKFRGIRVELENNLLKLVAHNPEQEEATEEIEVEFDQPESIAIGFNVSYLIDVLNVLDCEKIEIQLRDSNSSGIIKDPDDDNNLYVVMPMRL
ncbi:MAG: DNA polymerase III subunit beta [gamma proteobacterium symbiont of Bathyaustriella thionipta]|nr:DNA polymerase III subunit beta [gamma proteobacterium symbiont of Bathyaustriella thionipta]